MVRNADKLPFAVTAAFMAATHALAPGPGLTAALAGVALLMTLLSIYVADRSEGGSPPLARGLAIFWGIAVIANLLAPGTAGSFIASSPTGTLFIVLSLFALIPSLAMGRHFTHHYAKKRAPAFFQATPAYGRMMRDMTFFWAALFALAGLTAFIPVVLGAGEKGFAVFAFKVIIPLALTAALGITFTRKYPAHFLNRNGIGAPKPDREPPMEKRPLVIAVNGSPKGPAGNTSIMIGMLKTSLAARGVDLEEIHLSGLHIAYCAGCGHCLEKPSCWRKDDHAALLEKILGADGLILASPVYFTHVTAQMKTFIDRALALGHKPRKERKPGLAISVSAGLGETETAHYLGRVLSPFGFFPVGELTAIAVSPSSFMGREWVEKRAENLARDLASAIREKTLYPATDRDFAFYLFMRELVSENRDFMADDHAHWEREGFYKGFEEYAGQKVDRMDVDPAMRKAWLKEMIENERAGAPRPSPAPAREKRVQDFKSAADLLRAMPMGFNPQAAGNFKAVIEFRMTGPETFDAHLEIGGGKCVHHEGAHPAPDLTIIAPSDVWLAIAKGEIDGPAAYMSGKFRTEGDMGILMKMKTLFGQP